VVGLVCAALGLGLGAVLTGLNGIVLAKQIGKGASNEEKAATADLMVSEATSAGGAAMKLALHYGGKFMSGIKAASKGVMTQLFAKFKTVVGKFAAKTLGPVANWAKNIGYKLGFGLKNAAGGAGNGVLAKAGNVAKKVWNAPQTLRQTKFVQKVNSSNFMKNLERNANSLNQNRFLNAVDGKWAENLGERAGKKAFTGLENRLAASVAEDKKIIAELKGRNAAEDAGNRERARLQREIAEKRDLGETKQADRLEKRQDTLVARTEERAGARAERDAAAEMRRADKADAAKTAQDEARTAEFERDPERFQRTTQASQTKLEKVEERLKDPNLSDSDRAKLTASADRHRQTIAERQAVGATAVGADVHNNLWDIKGGYDIYSEATGNWENFTKGDEGAKEADAAQEKVVNEATGRSVFEDHANQAQANQLAAWSAQTPEAPQTAAQVESMLTGLDDELGLEPSGDADPDEAQQQDGDDDGGGDETASPQPAVAGSSDSPSPQPAQPAGANEDAAPDVPPLAYWPKLTAADGEFQKATKDLLRMKQIAHAFYRSQGTAKKKAMETAELLGKSGEDAGKKQDQAQQHTTNLNSTINEAKTSAGAADNATGGAGKGEKSQGDSRGQAGGSPQQAPDPGEKPSRWRPIKRIWWHVKKWAADKAAKVFGWIQEKIASLILNAICGVSMGDMKAYTTALHRRMQYSSLVGAQGVDAANQAMAESAKTKTESKSHADQALADAAECDQNMTDADAFIKNVEATEQDLVAEHARAEQFLASLHAAVQAEKQRRAEEQAKKAQEAKANAAAVCEPGPAMTPAPVAKPRSSEPKPLSPGAIGKVKGAAAYVVTQANKIVDQLTSAKGEQMSRLKAALEDKKKATREAFENKPVGDGVISEVRGGVSPIVSAMEVVKSATPTEAPELKGHAGTVKSKAKDVDELAVQAHESLNMEFKSTYEAIAQSA
jgi:hypothetical protein